MVLIYFYKYMRWYFWKGKSQSRIPPNILNHRLPRNRGKKLNWLASFSALLATRLRTTLSDTTASARKSSRKHVREEGNRLHEMRIATAAAVSYSRDGSVLMKFWKRKKYILKNIQNVCMCVPAYIYYVVLAAAYAFVTRRQLSF